MTPAHVASQHLPTGSAQWCTARLPDQPPALLGLLLQGLDLLQGIQQHRGLGGQSTSEARQRCQALGQALQGHWQHWPYPQHHQAWQALRQRPDDFDGHCRLLQELLGALQQLELRRCALTLQTPTLAEHCWQLEDLGLLRGLSVRTASQGHCPLQTRIQLQYLMQRLNQPALAQALGQLRSGLLDHPTITLTGPQCYALLTPLIDERLQAIRRAAG